MNQAHRQIIRRNTSATRDRGFATLLAVLIMGAIGTVVVLALLQLGFGASHNSLLTQERYQAKMLADACTEKALDDIITTPTYTGTQTITLGAGNCSVTVTSSSVPKTIQSTGTVDNVVQRATVTVTQVTPTVTITTWQYVSSF